MFLEFAKKSAAPARAIGLFMRRAGGYMHLMPVTTGGVEPARGHWRVVWWLSFAIGVAGVAAALITGRGHFAASAFLLIYPLQRLFWSRPGSDPSKTGWQRARERRGSP
jgi:hypothetical protein